MVLLVACAGEPPPSAPLDAGHAIDAVLAACASKQGTLGSIDDLVDTVNAMPKPVSLACAVAALPRPLELVATNSVTSMQPASGPENPRLFILEPAMVISVVGDGVGAPLLEMGQWVTPLRTLKAEITFPLAGALDHQTPYEEIRFNAAVTHCGLCHREEEASESIDGGFVSIAFRPSPDSIVPFEVLTAQHEACTEASERCALFHALFDFGEARPSAFRENVKIFGR